MVLHGFVMATTAAERRAGETLGWGKHPKEGWLSRPWKLLDDLPPWWQAIATGEEPSAGEPQSAPAAAAADPASHTLDDMDYGWPLDPLLQEEEGEEDSYY